MLSCGVAASPAARAEGALIDVPYLTQTEALCGGASLAMVLRYWGLGGVNAEDFAPLVDPSRRGIPERALAAAVIARGWRADVLAAASRATLFDTLATELGQGRPIIALIEDRPRTFHYVVVVGMAESGVVLHDPARAPYRVMDRSEFAHRSAAAHFWMLRVLPPADRGEPSIERVNGDPSSEDAPAGACAGVVAASVDAANAGDRAGAERGLVGAVLHCPADAPAWRELAGLRFVEARYDEAAALAAQAARVAPGDRASWELLGSSEYMRDELGRALDAWNRADRPRVDVVSVTGVTRTRQPIVVSLTGLAPKTLLTSASLDLAERRLSELPVATATGIRYTPIDGGHVAIDAAVAERTVLPEGLVGWGAVGVAAAFRREIRIDAASPTGSGELWTGAYRWAANRPRVRFALSAPVRPGVPAVADVDFMWERQTYGAASPGGSVSRETRRRGGGHLSAWASRWLRWQAGGALDRFDDRDYVAIDGRVALRAFDDRLAGVVAASRWMSASRDGFSTVDLSALARSTTRANVPVLSARVAVSLATTTAPLAVWPVAGSSDARGVLLRGHTLFDDGVITSPQLGRRLADATVEYLRPVHASAYGTTSVAVFADTARATARRDGWPDARLDVDVGIGARIEAPALGGQFRVDAGIGVRDRTAKKLSAGYVAAWGK